MDPPPLCWPISPPDHHPQLSPLHAQQLLQRLGWSYYTIWKEASMPHSLGLVWSNGDISNRSAATYIIRSGQLIREVAAGERDDQNARMGLLSLQRYYRQCFLPLGLGIAGLAMLARRHQWASGEELLLQISSMSQVQQPPAPPHLQAQLFKDASIQTVVCVPLHMAGVLELGTTDSVPESKELLDQIHDFIGLARVAAMSSARDHNYYGDQPDKQLECRLWNMSNYYGSSSSNSPLSMKSNSNTHGEVSPLISSATSSAMADFEIDILKQMCIDIATVNTTAASLNHPATISHNQHDVSLTYSTSLVSPSPASLSNHNYDHNYSYDSSNYSDIDIRHVHHDFPIDAVPSNIHNIGLPSSDQASLIQLRQQLQVDFPACHSLPSHQRKYINYAHTHDQGASHLSTPISPGSHQRKYINYAHTHDQGASHLSTPISPGSFIDSSPNSFMTCSSNLNLSTHFGIFKPWSKQNPDIEMNEDAPRSDSLLKRCLLHFLPERHRETNAHIRSARCDATGNPQILLGDYELSRIRKPSTYGLHNRNASNIRKGQQNEGAKDHMIAERKRRRRQSDSFKQLKSLVPSIIKKDKVTILEQTLHYLKQLQDSVDELTQANHLLIMQGAATQHANASVMASQQQLLSPGAPPLQVEEAPLSSPKTNSICRLLPSTDVQVLMTSGGRQLPLFHLSMNITVHHEEANDTVIKVVSALNDKGMQCIRVEAEFSENTSSLSAKLLAQFKDAENHTPSPHELLEIREWWRLLSLTFSSAKKDHDQREFQE